MCPPEPGDDACVKCVKVDCCPEAIKCSEDQACVCIIECLADGGTQNQCFGKCGFSASALALGGCAQQKCPGVCS